MTHPAGTEPEPAAPAPALGYGAVYTEPGAAYPGPGTPPPVYYYPPAPDRFTRLLMRIGARFPRWSAPAAIAACFVGAAGFVLVSDPTDDTARDLPGCVVKLTTGFDCPGCGGTRAFYYLITGSVPQAARHHAVAVFAAPFLLWMYVAWVAQRHFGRRLPAPRITPRAISIFLGAWAVFTIARNLPWAPFTWFYV